MRLRVRDGADFANDIVLFPQKALSTMIEARAFSEFMASDQVEVHRKAHLVLNLNPGHVHPQLAFTPLAWPSCTRTPSVHYVDKPRTDGETVPSRVFAEVIGFAVTVLCETQFTVSPVTATLSQRSQKNWGSPRRAWRPPSSCPSDPGSRDPSRPADIWVSRGPSGQAGAWDFSISAGLCPSLSS